jgi:hypothetical protein
VVSAGFDRFPPVSTTSNVTASPSNWVPLVSSGFVWFPLVSTGFYLIQCHRQSFKLVSSGFHRFPLVSTGFQRVPLYPISPLVHQFGFPWFHPVSAGFSLHNFTEIPCKCFLLVSRSCHQFSPHEMSTPAFNLGSAGFGRFRPVST